MSNVGGSPNFSTVIAHKKDHWLKQADGSYVSSHPKYDGMRITKVNATCWQLTQRGLDPVNRTNLFEAKRLAYQEANWIAPSVRIYE